MLHETSMSNGFDMYVIVSIEHLIQISEGF